MGASPARSPEEVDVRLAEAFRARDLEAVMALYEPGATFVMQPGQPVSGEAQIRAAVGMFLAMKPDLRLDVIAVFQAGDIALLASDWTLTTASPDGKPVTLSGRGAEVVRRQPDGAWRFVIDNPFAG